MKTKIPKRALAKVEPFLGAADIRAEDDKGKNGVCRERYVPMGETLTEGGNRRPVWEGKVETPFRDGSHAHWDKQALGLPNLPIYAQSMIDRKAIEEQVPLTVCEDCPDKKQCASYGSCVGSIMAEAQEIEEDYIAAGICSDCGACSLTDANNKCRPKQYPSGEWSCAGEKLWEREDDND